MGRPRPCVIIFGTSCPVGDGWDQGALKARDLGDGPRAERASERKATMSETDGLRGSGGQGAIPTTYLAKNEITTLATSTVLQQRYLIEGVLGLGGMGAVYKVRDLRFSGATKYCALKEMITKFSDALDERTTLTNFEREANMLASLNHPAVPKIYDFFAEHSRAYLVLEYVEGRDLEAVLKDTQGPISEHIVGDWALQLCDVLNYLHMHTPPIIFRDLKPSNVILTPPPTNRIVLIDFGIAKALQQGKKGTMVGTEGYSSPEQYRGVAEPRSDIYSLGAMMHHLLTRSDPRFETPFTFTERMPRSLNPTISPEMEAVVMRCVEYDVEKRFHDVMELRLALEAALHVVSLGTGHFRTTAGTPGIPRTANAQRGAPVSGTLIGTGLLWKFQTEDEVRGSPAVSSDSVYIGSYDKHMYSLDRHNGRPRWKFPTEGGICCTPGLWKELVVLGSEDFNVYGIDATSGQEVWTYRTWHHVRSSPRVYRDCLYIGSDDAHLHALDPRNGRPLWKFQTYRPVRSSAAYADGVVLFGSDDERIYAVDAQTGEERWRHATQGGITSSPATGNGLAYVGSTDFSVYALDLKMGWQAWRERTANFVISSPCVVDERLFIGSVDQHLYCLDAKTGRIVWKYQAGGQITSSPAVAGDNVYFGCVDGAVYALDAGTGRRLWRFQTEGAVPSSPVVVDGVVYIGSMDGCVYALRA
jgi:outer membrane protein assembly factor BamB/tRNA A-37 threonylcarbamoyl transferase component Bud32